MRGETAMVPTATPDELSPEVVEFCRRLDPTQRPVWAAVRPSPGAVAGADAANLKPQVARQGGRVQWGWVIGGQAGWFLEAEFRGLWIAPSGEAVDIAPRRDRAERLLFLPDSRRTFRGEGVPNQFLALSNSPDVLAVVQNAEMHARLRAEAETQARRSQVRPGSADRNDPCPCGSGLKYKKCCGARV